jgi:hypothetical protein
MRLQSFAMGDRRLGELLPGTTPTVGTMPTTGSGQQAQGQQAQGQQSGLAGGGMDPAQAAQAAKDQQEEKKQVQDQIKATEQQLIDLRKRLAELG